MRIIFSILSKHLVNFKIFEAIFESSIQNIESEYCGIFLLYLYENLFGLRENSKNLTRGKIQTLLHELFSFDH